MSAITSTRRRSLARRAPRLAIVAGAVAAVTASRPACAQPALPSLLEAPPPEAPPPPARPKRWYGWQIILADVAPLAALTAGGVALARSNSGVGAGFLTGGFFAGHFVGPVVHAFHRVEGEDMAFKAGIDYAMRALLPALTLLAGYGIGAKHCVPRDGCLTGVIGGMIAGSYAASIIDATVFAWEGSFPPPTPVVRPTLSPAQGGFVAGLTGTF